ncbi:MAG: ATP-binding cassette domain-containing protein [Spirochaetes bacterium]|nr:ATP-binding cassette domain-containing protein [Spirochaetota bacterium]
MKALEIKNLQYSYPNGKQALRGVDLEIGAGMRTAVIGKNGSGKSTLILHILGLLDGDGFIAVSGIVRAKKTITEIRKRAACLFSRVEYQFIMPDLLNDIMLSLPESLSREEKVKTASRWLERFNLLQYSRSSPLDLSSGEMKRAALLGVLIREPELLLLDEPLNNLDRESSIMLLEILGKYSGTILMTTHRRFLVQALATHIAVMQDGRVSGLYTVKEGLKKKDIQELLF